MQDFNGQTFTQAELLGKMAVTGKGQTVQIERMDSDGDARVVYPNGRLGWLHISELSVLA